MKPEDIFVNFSGEIWALVKILVLVILLFYLVFSFLVVRQAQLMTRTITGKLDKRIRVVARGFFLLIVFLFIAVLIFL